jgi:anti-sigma regulatory factor (Ser/Thr protein kinase)/DNA-binding NarL/FixJ family response regulator
VNGLEDTRTDAGEIGASLATTKVSAVFDGRRVRRFSKVDNMTRQRVMAIRPDPALVTILTSVLNSRYYELECGAGNVDTVQRLRARAYDVVITDPSTSIDEDLALASELKSVRPEIKTILLAPEAGHDDVLDAIRADVFACFTPPFDHNEIAAMTATALAAEDWSNAIQVVSGSAHWLTLKVSSHLLTADRVVRFMTELQSSAPDESRDLLIAAFRELLINAMEHGAGFDPEKIIEVTAARTSRAIVYHFKDPGTGFDRADLAHATASSSPDDVFGTTVHRAEVGLRPGGFGMLIVSRVADEIAYNERGNEVILIKHTN